MRLACTGGDRQTDRSMTKAAAKRPAGGGYEVGYGKPPKDRQFRKGQSGNPGGRPRAMSAGRAKALALKEAYRMVTVKEGDRVVSLVLGAILRSLTALAAAGNGPAQRFVFAMIEQIEQELAASKMQIRAAASRKITRDTSRPS